MFKVPFYHIHKWNVMPNQAFVRKSPRYIGLICRCGMKKVDKFPIIGISYFPRTSLDKPK